MTSGDFSRQQFLNEKYWVAPSIAIEFDPDLHLWSSPSSRALKSDRLSKLLHRHQLTRRSLLQIDTDLAQ